MVSTTGNELLDAFTKVSPFLIELYNNDISIAVCDREKYLAYEKSASYKMAYLQAGDKVKEGSLVSRAMQEGKKVTAFIPLSASAFGVPYQAIALPIVDEEHNMLGAVGIAMILEKEQERENTVNQFIIALDQVTAGVQEIASGSQNLATISEKLFTFADSTANDVNKSHEIISIMRRIADESRMLGLNASIEAARAGEKGKGFSIIAKEICRLSETSGQSVKQVLDILGGLTGSIGKIQEDAKETSSISVGQAAAVEEIVASMEQLKAQISILQALLQLK